MFFFIKFGAKIDVIREEFIFFAIDIFPHFFLVKKGTIVGHLMSSKKLSVLYIDAHADINTNLTSTTANLHGMPVAIVAKELSEYWGHLPGSEWLTNK